MNVPKLKVNMKGDNLSLAYEGNCLEVASCLLSIINEIWNDYNKNDETGVDAKFFAKVIKSSVEDDFVFRTEEEQEEIIKEKEKKAIERIFEMKKEKE